MTAEQRLSDSKQTDLHTHSTASDGTLSPTELVSQAAAAGIDRLALTDHDSVSGLDEAYQAAQVSHLQLIAGIELSALWNRQTVHIVGLGIDPQNAALKERLKETLAFRDWRGEEMARRLQKVGIEGAYEGALKHCQCDLISRTHFAHYLAEAGYAKDVPSVFKKYLVRGKPGHVPGQWAPLVDAVAWIRAAGGLAVIAHPARYRLNRSKLRRLIGDFIAAGGVSLEVVSGSQSPPENSAMAAHANDFGLSASAGSDYHGPEKPWVQLGRLAAMPRNCVPIWERYPSRFA